jgi:short-subunit dehydrogenase
MEMDTMTIIVTGAFGGIGEAVSRELAENGHAVIRVARRLPPDAHPGRMGWFTNVGANLSSPDGWRYVLDSASSGNRPVDALVHCAGALIATDFGRMSPDDLRAMLDDNLLSLFLGFRALLPGMIERRRGRLIVIGSLGGIVPMPHGSVYAATKFAVRGFALSMAEELRGSGVDVSLLSCGPVHTRMLRREAMEEGTIGFVNRPLSPARVAETVVQLLDRPRREAFLPRSQGLPAPLLGAYTRIFKAIYPLLSAAGSSGKRKYRTGIAGARILPGE